MDIYTSANTATHNFPILEYTPQGFHPSNGFTYSTDQVSTEPLDVYKPTSLVRYVDGGCGTGKTYSTCLEIREWRFSKNQLYVAPTTALLYQTAELLRELKVAARVICHETALGGVKSQIMEYLRTCTDSGNVLLITWAAYSSLPYFHRRGDWTVYIDEIPQVDTFYDPLVPYNFQFLTSFLELGEPVNETVSRVRVRDNGELKRYLERHSNADDVYRQFHDLLADALSPHKDLFVDTASWNRVIECGEISSVEDRNRIFFLSMLNPALFQGATILGANMENSMLYGWLTGFHGVKFHENMNISSNLRPSMDLQGRLRIVYFSGKRWSKSLRDKVLEGNVTVMERLEGQIIPLIQDRPFLLVANNDYVGDLTKLPNAVKLPVQSKGMNEYTDHNLIVHLPALNRKPAHISLLNRLGVDAERIAQSTAYETLYQNVMRTCLRDPESTEIVDIIVPSRDECAFLTGILGSQEVRQINCDEFKTYSALSQVQKNNRARANQVNKRIQSVAPCSSENGYHFSYSIKKKGNQKWELEGSYNGYLISYYADKWAYDSSEVLIVHYMTMKEFVSDLKKWADNPVKDRDKEKVPLISSVIYDPAGEGRWRRQQGFLSASMMILDFDGGTVSPEIFTDIFWDKASGNSRRSFVLVNSFSRSPYNPNRFRVFLPLKAPATSLEEYQAVYDSIVDRLEAAGHKEEASGLDDNARNGVQAFYVPCTNRLYPDSGLFIKRGCSPNDLEKYVIDPEGYGRTALRKVEKAVMVPVDGYGGMDEPTRLAKIEAIKSEYLAVPVGKGLRNDAFFHAANQLAKFLPKYEVENILWELAGDDPKMQGRIKDKMKSVLGRYH